MTEDSAKQFPPIRQLTRETWEVFKKSVLYLLILGVVGIFVTIAHIITSIAGLGILGFGLNQFANLRSQPIETASQLLKSGWSLFIFVGIMLALGVALKLLFEAAAIVVVGDTKQVSLGSALRRGLKAIIPLWLTGILATIIQIGNFGALVIPGIIVSIFLTFVTFEIVLAHKKLFGAIKGSAQIISQNFVDVIARIILFWGFYFVIFFLFPGIIRRIDSASEIYLNFLTLFISIFVGWYTLVYYAVLYRQAYERTDFKRSIRLWWMWLGAIIGWLLLIPLVYGGIQAAKGLPWNQWLENRTNTARRISIGEYTENMSPEAKAHWQKSQELFSQMRANNQDPKKVTQLNDENIKELRAALETDPDNPRLWVDLGDAFTWVNSQGTLEDGLAAYQEASELDPNNVIYSNYVGDVLIRLERYEDAILQLQKSLRIYEKSGFAHNSLGVAYYKLNLTTPAREHFNKAIEIFTAENNKGQFDDEILEAQKFIGQLEK